MMRTLRNFMFLVFAALQFAFLAPANTALAVEAGYNREARYILDEHDDALKAIKRGEIMSFSQIRRSVESRLGGRVVDIKLRRTNRGWQYFLRVSRKDGRVVAAAVDAKTARILSTR